MKFQDNWSLLQEKKEKTDFQDDNNGSHLGFPIRTILAIFYLQVTLMCLSKFHINWPLFLEKKQKMDFQTGGYGGHLGFPIGTILAILDLKVIAIFPTKFRRRSKK